MTYTQQQQENLVKVDFTNAHRRLPPQNVETEEWILGGIMLDPNAIARIADVLEPEAFYINAHKEIYKAALALHSLNRPTDLVCVMTWLYDNDLLEKVGGQNKLVQLVDRTVSSINIDVYAKLVTDKYLRRQLIYAGNEIVQLGYETHLDLEEVLDSSEQKVFSITEASEAATTEVEAPIDIMLRVYDQLRQPKLKGHPTGIIELDALIGGLKRKRFYIVAGRSSMGKTQFATYCAAHLLKAKQPVIFFSAEMDRDQIMTRVLAWESGVDSKAIDEGTVTSAEDFNKLGAAINTLSDIPLWLDDTDGSSLTPMKIRSTIRRAASKYGKPALVVLDYLQLLGDESGKSNRVTELDGLSRACKSISQEFDVPFMALAQINRSTEQQSNKRPGISQIRECGAIEQDADVIILLYREDYYNPNTNDKGICEIIVGKQRGGPTGTVKTIFKPETSRFLNIAKRDFD
jgi:replicative DNA helicase